MASTFERFTDRARRVLVLAQEEARTLDHSHIGTEHILLGLLREGADAGALALASVGVTLEDVRGRVEDAVRPGGRGSGSPPFTPGAKKVLELSLRESLALGDQHIGTGHLLLGLLREGDGLAVQVLVATGVDANELRDEVLVRLGAEPGPVAAESEPALRRCSFCGRGVDQAEHFVAALGSGAICSDCITEAGRALEDAGADPEVFLPLRITGAPPDAEAVDAIARALRAAFVAGESLAHRRAAVEDFDELQPFLTLASRAAPISSTMPARIRFVDPTSAVVDFHVFVGPDGTVRTVRLESDGSRWFVPFDAMRAFLGEFGVAVPRRRGGRRTG